MHEAFKDIQLSLLADDMEAVTVAVDSHLILGGYYGVRPRADSETPRLESDAGKLIELLREKCPE